MYALYAGVDDSCEEDDPAVMPDILEHGCDREGGVERRKRVRRGKFLLAGSPCDR